MTSLISGRKPDLVQLGIDGLLRKMEATAAVRYVLRGFGVGKSLANPSDHLSTASKTSLGLLSRREANNGRCCLLMKMAFFL